MKTLLGLLVVVLAACGDNGATECSVAADCPGTEGECLHKVCDTGACKPEYAPVGTAITDQSDGDCHQRQCDGAGVVVEAVDDTDAPHDDNPCTNDVCTGGVPSHPAADAATSCGTGLQCDGDGTCKGCLNWTQCPGHDDECQTRTCSQDGVCGFEYAAQGKTRTTQVAADCHKIVCNGTGGSQTVVDDTDLPNDSNPCTTDVCTGGVSSHPPVAIHTACGTGLECDGATHCVGCVMASECPGPDTDCQTRTCTTGTCGFSYAPTGTPTTAQTAGDCIDQVCNGAGGTTMQANDGDVPVDSTVCTDNVCTSGVPSNPAVPTGTPCSEGGGIECDGTGMCVQCLSPGECPAPPNDCQVATCTNGTCGFVFVPDGTPCTGGTCQGGLCQ